MSTETIPTAPTAPSSAASPAIDSRPARIRFAAVVWGTIIAIISVSTILVIQDPVARQAVGDFLTGITVGTSILIGVLLVGFLILVGGLLAMVHRWQSNRRK